VAKERDHQYGELPNAVFLSESGVQSRCRSLRNRAVLISSIEVEDKNLWKTENYRRTCSLIYIWRSSVRTVFPRPVFEIRAFWMQYGCVIV